MTKKKIENALVFFIGIVTMVFMGNLFMKAYVIHRDEVEVTYAYMNSLNNLGKSLMELTFQNRFLVQGATLSLGYLKYGCSILTTCFQMKIYLILSYISTFALIYEKEDKIETKFTKIILLSFLFLPSEYTNFYHMQITIVSLMIILVIDRYNEYVMPLLAFLVGLIIFGICTATDILLLVCNIILPLIFAILLRVWNKKEKRHFFVLVLPMIVIIYALISMLTNRGVLNLGAIYGGDAYTTWNSLASAIVDGTRFLLESCTHEIGITSGIGLINEESIIICVKYTLLLMIFWAFIAETKSMFKDLDKLKLSDIVMIIGVWILGVINMFNKVMVDHYLKFGYMATDDRYMSLAKYSLIILAFRYWFKKIDFALPIIKKINMAHIISVSIAILIALLINRYPVEAQSKQLKWSKEATEYLINKGYTAGLYIDEGYTHVLDFWSDGKIKTYTYGLLPHKGLLDDLDVNTSINFIYIREKNKEFMDILDKSDYIEKYEFGDKNDAEAFWCAYLYDRDVRWKSFEIDCAEIGTNEVPWFFPSGTSKIIVYKKGMPEDVLADINDNVLDVKAEATSNLEILEITNYEDKVEYFIRAKETTEAILKFKYYVTFKTCLVQAYTDVINDLLLITNHGENRIIIPSMVSGEYILYVSGNNIKMSQFSSNNCDIQLLSAGNKSARYSLKVNLNDEDIYIDIKNNSKTDIIIDNMNYALESSVYNTMMDILESFWRKLAA